MTIYLPLKRPLVYFFQCIFPISLLYFSLQPYLYFISIIMLLNDEVIVMIRGDLVIANFCSFFSFPRRRISKSPFPWCLSFLRFGPNCRTWPWDRAQGLSSNQLPRLHCFTLVIFYRRDRNWKQEDRGGLIPGKSEFNEAVVVDFVLACCIMF